MKNRPFEISPLLEKISNFDYNTLYTPGIRIFLHCSMWIFFTTLFFFNFYLENNLAYTESLFLATRTTINNIVLFYLYFYIIFPRLLKLDKWGFYLIILCIPLSLYIWLITNLIQFRVLYFFNFDIEHGQFKGVVSKYSKITFLQTISYKAILGNAMIVIFSYSPPFFLKILFNITQIFSKTIFYQKQNLNLELENVNIEKDFLKAQLNPHFLFNTLNNLYGLVIKKDPGAPDAIIKISEIMSYTLYESNTEKVYIEKEIEFIQNYFYLEKMRYSHEKEITLDISISNEKLSLQIAPLLTFAFIENAFKYGIGNTTNDFIRISIKIVNNIFYFNLENNKNSQIKKNSKLGGIGVKNTQKRLNLIYKNAYDLNIKDDDDRYSVSLKINLQNDEQ